MARGNDSAAVKLYDQVRKADVPKQRMLEATRGAILAQARFGRYPRRPCLASSVGARTKALNSVFP